MKTVLIVLSILILIVLFAWVGLQIKPKQFPAYVSAFADIQTVPILDDLSAPVERYYRQLYGDSIPIFDSAVISGTGRMNIAGIWLPACFRFTFIPGQEYRYYFENTLFGIPFFKVTEHFLGGTAAWNCHSASVKVLR